MNQVGSLQRSHRLQGKRYQGPQRIIGCEAVVLNPLCQKMMDNVRAAAPSDGADNLLVFHRIPLYDRFIGSLFGPTAVARLLPELNRKSERRLRRGASTAGILKRYRSPFQLSTRIFQ